MWTTLTMEGRYISLSALCFALLVYSTNGFVDDPLSAVDDRLSALETKLEQALQEIAVLQGCTTDYCAIHWSSWTDWSPWSHCMGQCNQGYGAREQTRTRTRLCLHEGQLENRKFCNGTNAEVDRRPCNSVEFYGCINQENVNNTEGHYALAYNFLDELAQSTCTAALTSAAHASAVRRNCISGKADQCSTICANLGYACYDELHVYQPTILKPNVHSQTDEGKQGLAMYRYFSCTWTTGGCGPNYCCCKY